MQYSAACQYSLESLGLVTTLLERAELQCFVGYSRWVCGWKKDRYRRYGEEIRGKNNLKQANLEMEKGKVPEIYL